MTLISYISHFVLIGKYKSHTHIRLELHIHHISLVYGTLEMQSGSQTNDHVDY